MYKMIQLLIGSVMFLIEAKADEIRARTELMARQRAYNTEPAPSGEGDSEPNEDDEAEDSEAEPKQSKYVLMCFVRGAETWWDGERWNTERARAWKFNTWDLANRARQTVAISKQQRVHIESVNSEPEPEQSKYVLSCVSEGTNRWWDGRQWTTDRIHAMEFDTWDLTHQTEESVPALRGGCVLIQKYDSKPFLTCFILVCNDHGNTMYWSGQVWNTSRVCAQMFRSQEDARNAWRDNELFTGGTYVDNFPHNNGEWTIAEV